MRLAREAEYPIRLTQTLNVWADLVRSDEPEAADVALAEAERVAPYALAAAERGRTSLLGAQVRAEMGDSRGAVESLRRALTVWDGDIPAFYVAIAAARAAMILAALEQAGPAAVVMGPATAGPHAQLSRIADPRARQEFDKTMQRLRATLGPDVYDTEAVRGAGMSRDDVQRFLSTRSTICPRLLATDVPFAQPPRDIGSARVICVLTCIGDDLFDAFSVCRALAHSFGSQGFLCHLKLTPTTGVGSAYRRIWRDRHRL